MSLWQTLLAGDERRVLPWLGGQRVYSKDRAYTVMGPLPPEYGWYTFYVSGGRKAKVDGPADLDPDYVGQRALRGYLIGDRFVPDTARVDPDPSKLVDQTRPTFCIEPGLSRFARAVVVEDTGGRLVYMSQEFPQGPEPLVEDAYFDRKDSVDDVPEVTPPLDLAFQFCTWQRSEEERREAERIAREAEVQRQVEEQERMGKLMRDAGTAVGRRELAKHDFRAAAKEALRVSNSELLDVRQSANRDEMVVQYRFRRRRLECVVHRETLRVIDAGVCLTDHGDGDKKYDDYFTLESLPGVIGWVMDNDHLVVWRHP